MNKPVRLFNSAVIVAALGYFVDIYDLVLFSIVRVPSLQALGMSGEELFRQGIFLLNVQMTGMLIGGIFWGILGDRRGRLSVLFGSIITYSVANLCNAAVHSIEAYAFWRFIAGIGLAGELGAGITLVSEILPQRLRGYGTMIVAGVGVTGAILAGLIGQHFDWRVCFVIGGSLGLGLLVLRVSVVESGIFTQTKRRVEVGRGNFFYLFRDRQRFFKYFRCILIGVPIWFIIGILVTFGPEFAQALGISEPVTGALSILFCYAGLTAGDFLSGAMSQWMQSRRKAILLYLGVTVISVIYYYGQPFKTANGFYGACAFVGFAAGYWAVFMTLAAEQFGTNIRATVATTVPNFVRGSVVPVTFLFKLSKDQFGILNAGWIVAVVTVGLALWSAWFLEETYHRDLDYVEGSH